MRTRVRYLDDRRAKGFNTLIVNLVEHLFLARSGRAMRPAGSPSRKAGDMGTPNDAYSIEAERVLDACAARGIA